MLVVNPDADAHKTGDTVPKIFPSAYPAYAANIAMKWPLFQRCPQVASYTMILGECHATMRALVRLGRLS